MRVLIGSVLAIAIGLSTPSAWAEGEQAGEFDYYVLALSWSPTWCALTGDARDHPQCKRSLGFILHGLWPQYENGWPSYCPTDATPPSREDTAAMTDIMGGAGSAWHQWRKHGVCSGLSSDQYFATARAAYEAIERPDVLRAVPIPVDVPPKVIEEAFLQSNPELEADGVTVTCKARRIQEVRICLTHDLEPRPCSGSVARDCPADFGLLDPVR